MIRAVLFDLYETLVTLMNGPFSFGAQLAEEAGIPAAEFLGPWRVSDADRTCGRRTLEEVLTEILRAHGRYSPALLERLVARRRTSAEAAFDHLHPEVLPMLAQLRARGLRTGMISNCYPEEAAALWQSGLPAYFDALLLSCEEGVSKPDPAIFLRCTRALGVVPEECLYVGDGGSQELEAAAALGMQTAQALWYWREGSLQPCGPKSGFRQLMQPQNLLQIIESEKA